MAGARVSMEVGNDGVALVTFSNPPVNALEITTLMKLKEVYDEVIRRNDVKAIVITGANGKFSSGFDLKFIKLVQETSKT
ncbi:peroxisomal fatty acid beta-oxidation multifunctional protein-like [Chenopodium quinoa]|uniref:peroxisomal fatty acid beta-oxidation multifunctional protein-like n=1 Tax=Chenopodium quinoa TaxID=63459 RepID=UPI000B780C93|nr:peroxisomal fatty acid beta-oxidation multifunctional protein-like [Chenopodium quinoa]